MDSKIKNKKVVLAYGFFPSRVITINSDKDARGLLGDLLNDYCNFLTASTKEKRNWRRRGEAIPMRQFKPRKSKIKNERSKS